MNLQQNKAITSQITDYSLAELSEETAACELKTGTDESDSSILVP